MLLVKNNLLKEEKMKLNSIHMYTLFWTSVRKSKREIERRMVTEYLKFKECRVAELSHYSNTMHRDSVENIYTIHVYMMWVLIV